MHVLYSPLLHHPNSASMLIVVHVVRNDNFLSKKYQPWGPLSKERPTFLIRVKINEEKIMEMSKAKEA